MKACILALLMLFASPLQAQWRTVDYPIEGASVGAGWKSLHAAQADAFCVDFKEKREPAQQHRTRTGDFRLSEKLTRSSSLVGEVSFMVAGAVGMGVKGTFVGSYTYSIEDKSFYVIARVENQPEVAEAELDTPLGLKQKYVEMLKAGAGLSQFYKECGDSFVLRRVGGAELIALTTIKDLTEEEKSDVSLTYNAPVVAFKLEGTLNNKDTRERIEKWTTFSYGLIGGSGAKGATDLATLNELASKLSEHARDAPRYWRLDLRRYETLPNWPLGLSLPIHETRMRSAADMYARVQQIEAVARSAMVSPDEYISDSIFRLDLERIIEDTRERMQSLQTLMIACTKDAPKCNELPETDTFNYYWYYTRLPLRRGANAYDVRKKILESRHAEAKKKLDDALSEHDRLFRGPPIPRSCETLLNPPPVPPRVASIPGGPHPALRAVLDACVALEHASRQLYAGSFKDEEDAIKATVTQRWLRSLHSEACDLELGHPMCLSPARLREWEEAIAARKYGWCKAGYDVLTRCLWAYDRWSQGLFSRSPDNGP